MRFHPSTDLKNYLHAQIDKYGLPALLSTVYMYGVLTNPDPSPFSFDVLVLVCLAGLFVMARLQRWTVYALLALALIVLYYAFVLVIAKGSQDLQSTRDFAAETTAQSFLQGQNAWKDSNENLLLTTGPTSVILAVPVVWAFGEINWLSFGFWVLFSALLLGFDLQKRNGTWPLLAMLILAGSYGFDHTLFWALDELYYPFVYLALAYIWGGQRRWLLVGAMFAACILTRSNYAFLLMGMVFWWLFDKRLDRAALIRMSAGFAVTGIALVTPFILVGKQDFWVHNPWQAALEFSQLNWFDSNAVFRALNHFGQVIGPGLARWFKLLASAGIIGLLAWLLKRHRLAHPFWHVAVGSLVAHTFAWLPVPPRQFPLDYSLMIVMPAMLAIALTPSTNENIGMLPP
jgi:hypothetical protein